MGRSKLRMSFEEVSRIAVGRMRARIFMQYSESDLYIVGGTISEHYVTTRTYRYNQSYGKITWDAQVLQVLYRVSVCHDGDVYFSIIVMTGEKNHVACLINATFKNLATKTKFAIEYAADPSGGRIEAQRTVHKPIVPA